MPFNLAIAAFITATACLIGAALGGFHEAVRVSFLIMLFALGMFIGGILADGNTSKGGDR